MKLDLKKVEVQQAKAGKTLKELGIPVETLYRVRKGGGVHPKTVHKIANALNCNIEDIIAPEPLRDRY